jgi:hypothetical protein
MRGIDFIGDIHGQAELLRKALRELGYRQQGKIFRHPDRIAVFLGDLLNRGPAVRSSVNIVRPMVNAGSAVCLLGNHEAFALWDRLFAKSPMNFTPLPVKAGRHLADSKAAFRGRSAEWDELMNWFWLRPLFFDNGRARGIHACWHTQALRCLSRNRLTNACFDSTRPEFHALWKLVEGPSARHPWSGIKFRIRWWERQATTWAGFAYSARSDLMDAPLPKSRLSLALPYAADAPPCFFGHYGFRKPAAPLLPNLACLDLAVAQGGPIGIYRWSGEERLVKNRFVSIGP